MSLKLGQTIKLTLSSLKKFIFQATLFISRKVLYYFDLLKHTSTQPNRH